MPGRSATAGCCSASCEGVAGAAAEVAEGGGGGGTTSGAAEVPRRANASRGRGPPCSTAASRSAAAAAAVAACAGVGAAASPGAAPVDVGAVLDGGPRGGLPATAAAFPGPAEPGGFRRASPFPVVPGAPAAVAAAASAASLAAAAAAARAADAPASRRSRASRRLRWVAATAHPRGSRVCAGGDRANCRGVGSAGDAPSVPSSAPVAGAPLGAFPADEAVGLAAPAAAGLAAPTVAPGLPAAPGTDLLAGTVKDSVGGGGAISTLAVRCASSRLRASAIAARRASRRA